MPHDDLLNYLIWNVLESDHLLCCSVKFNDFLFVFFFLKIFLFDEGLPKILESGTNLKIFYVEWLEARHGKIICLLNFALENSMKIV